MELQQASTTLCASFSAAEHQYVTTVLDLLRQAGWQTVPHHAPFPIVPSLERLPVSYRGFPFLITFSQSGKTIHALGKTHCFVKATARSIRQLTRTVEQKLLAQNIVSHEQYTALSHWLDALPTLNSPQNHSRYQRELIHVLQKTNHPFSTRLLSLVHQLPASENDLKQLFYTL